MIYGVYSIHDQAAGVFTAPTLDISDASAIRNFEQAMANPSSVMNFRPADFSVYKVGTFNVETGLIEPLVPLVCLKIGSDVKEV